MNRAHRTLPIEGAHGTRDSASSHATQMTRRVFVTRGASVAAVTSLAGAASLEAQPVAELARKRQDNKAIVGRWFAEFWGNPWNPKVIDELAAPDMLLQYSLHAPHRGREDVRAFMEALLPFSQPIQEIGFFGAVALNAVFSVITLAMASGVVFDGSKVTSAVPLL